MLTSHLRANLLLPPPSPLQLVGGQGQGHSPQGCGKEDLPQAWCQSQLRECRLQEKRETAIYISPGEVQVRQSCPRKHKGTGTHQALGGYLLTRNNGETATSREGNWPAPLKCGPQRCKERTGDGKMMMPTKEITPGIQQVPLTTSVMHCTTSGTALGLYLCFLSECPSSSR